MTEQPPRPFLVTDTPTAARTGPAPIGLLLAETNGDIDAGLRGPAGVPTGFTELDLITGGLRPGHLHVIVGHPGVGTSTLALDFARHTAIANGMPALIASLASPRSDILTRVLAAESRVAVHHLRSGRMTGEDYARLANKLMAVADSPLYIDDTPYGDIDEFHAVTLGADVEWRLVVIDGAALLTRRTAPEHLWAAHTKLAQDAKLLARKLDVPVVMTVSASRQITKREGMPVAGDVAVSAAYEAEADMVIGLYRPDLFDRHSPRTGEADLIVMKSRVSPVGKVTLAYQGHFARFVDADPAKLAHAEGS